MIVWLYRPTVLFRLEAEAGMSTVCGGGWVGRLYQHIDRPEDYLSDAKDDGLEESRPVEL